MPQLQWNDYDFALCLEVMPEVDVDKVEYVYTVDKDGLVLTVTVWQYESVIGLSLRAPSMDNPAMEFALYVRGPVTYINDKRGEYLRLEDCIITSSRFSYIEAGDLWDNIKFPSGLPVVVAVRPGIRVRGLRANWDDLAVNHHELD